MQKSAKKGFLGRHAKSSALAVSLVFHAILIVVAASFVAVKVVLKNNAQFEAKQIERPKMPIKKLQVPVKVQRKPKPRLRKQITVKSRIDRKMPDIKMPEVTGVRGGLGSVGNVGGYGVGGVGFSLPEINIFGVKSHGEKIFIMLDARAEMMYDEMGGIAAYTLIKQELIRILEGLPSTVLFNVAVFQKGNRQRVFSSSWVNASKKNLETVKKWIEPLNAVSAGMGDRDFGIKTLGPGGEAVEEIHVDPIQSYGDWVAPALMAMKQQADSVYLLTCAWGNLGHRLGTRGGTDAEKRKWDALYAKAKKKLDQDNAQRRKHGQPPRILSGRMSIIKAYYPNAKPPGKVSMFAYTPKVIATAMNSVRRQYASGTPASGLSKKPGKYSFNVVQFVARPSSLTERQKFWEERSRDNLKQMVNLCHGQYQSISGLEAIQSYVGKEEAKK